MSVQRVQKYFEQFDLSSRIHVFTSLTATVQQAADTLGVSADQIAKSLAFTLKDKDIVIVTSGLSKVSNQKFKQVFQQRPQMVGRDKVEEVTGYQAGAVCPFALNSGIEVYLDRSLKKYDQVFPAAGDVNAAIRLSISELEKYSHPQKWIDVAK